MSDSRPSTIASDEQLKLALNTHLPLDTTESLVLEPPNPNFAVFTPFGDSPRDSYRDSYAPSQNNSSPLLVDAASADAEHTETPTGPAAPDVFNEKFAPAGRPRRRRPLLLLFLVAAFIVVVVAVVVPVYFTVIRRNQNKTSSGNSNNGAGSTNSASSPKPSASPNSPSGATTGSDGSTVTMADGTTFTYQNKFGGFWVSDPNDPFNNNAQANSWTPPLNTSWNWGVDQVMGVNIGGLFVLEPFISPALFEKYQNLSFPVIDEWSVSLAMAQDTAGGGLQQLEDHYNTFITEEDIAQIAGAGLNWIRVPIPYWAVDKWDGEPFLEKVCWKYILRLLGWARKYGLRVNLDLHTIPGSQNGYNHSGKQGQVNFLSGVMGVANAQRALGYIRTITEFISQPEYRDVVPMFGIMNEARLTVIGRDQLTRFYLQAHDMMREITGLGAGNGPYISIHDGFQGTASWAGFLPGSDRIILDTHPYFTFDGQPNTEPVSQWAVKPCEAWATSMNTSQSAFGVTVAGEFSNGYNDCAYFLNGIPDTHRFPGDCSQWTDSSQWTQATKNGIMNFALASMDALQNYFFWTWKIGNSSLTNSVGAPLWSYKLGLENGWMPTDPRQAVGMCASLGAGGDNPFPGTYSQWQTGGAGAGTISPAVSASFSQWPPPQITNLPGGGENAEFLPTYTPTAPIPTLPPPTLTPSVSAGDGWFNTQDTAGGWTTVAGCAYQNAWDSASYTLPTALCTAGAAKRTAAPEAVITPSP